MRVRCLWPMIGEVTRPAIRSSDIRAYLARDWARTREHKRTFWRQRLQRGGLREALLVTEQLRTWMMSTDATWPTQAQRDDDLETHARVAAILAKTPARPARPARTRAHRVR